MFLLQCTGGHEHSTTCPLCALTLWLEGVEGEWVVTSCACLLWSLAKTPVNVFEKSINSTSKESIIQKEKKGIGIREIALICLFLKYFQLNLFLLTTKTDLYLYTFLFENFEQFFQSACIFFSSWPNFSSR